MRVARAEKRSGRLKARGDGASETLSLSLVDRRRRLSPWSIVVVVSLSLWSIVSELYELRHRVGVDAFGCGSVCAEGTRADGIRTTPANQHNQGSSLFLLFLFYWVFGVCVQWGTFLDL